MKFIVFASVLIGSLAHAELHSFSCTGIAGSANVTVSGSYSVFQRAGRLVYKNEGVLDVSGSDGGGRPMFSRNGTTGGGTYRYFETVNYRSENGMFIARATSDTGGKLILRIPEDRSPNSEGRVRADLLEVDLPQVGSKPPYWHQFERATCTRD